MIGDGYVEFLNWGKQDRLSLARTYARMPANSNSFCVCAEKRVARVRNRERCAHCAYSLRVCTHSLHDGTAVSFADLGAWSFRDFVETQTLRRFAGLSVRPAARLPE